jgi:hypothetical protein
MAEGMEIVLAWSLSAETSGMISRLWVTKRHQTIAAADHSGLNVPTLLVQLPCERAQRRPRWLTLLPPRLV